MTSGTGACSVTATKAADANYATASSAAATVSASLAAQAVLMVTGVPATAQAYGATFTVGSSGGSGSGLVTFAATGACANSGSTVTITSSTGICSVTANKAADTDYSSTTSAPVTVNATAAAVAVPNVVGAAKPAAESAITGAGLTFTETQAYSSTVPSGSVISESPAAGTTVNTGTTVTLVISQGPPPNYVVTSSFDDAGYASNCTPQTGSCSLRDALLAAAAAGGGNISFSTTVFSGASTLMLINGSLSVPPATSITGPTTGNGASLANLLTVDGGNAGTVFTVATGVTGASIANLTIQNGNSSGSGGGINNQGSLVVTNVTVKGSTATTGAGGGINNTGTLVLTGSTVSANSASQGGGINNTGTLTVIDSTIGGNSSSGQGGGIENSGMLTVYDSTVSANSAVSGGGGIYTSPGAVTLANAIVSGNTTSGTADDIDGGYTDQGGNVVGSSAIALASLGSYGGPTQTMIPLPGGPAICAGTASSIAAGVTVDQRGLPNTNTGYPNYANSACVDAGAVQTNYALSFSTPPPPNVLAGANFSAAVTLTESGNPFSPAVTIPLTLNGNGNLSGGSAGTSAGVASYTLRVDTAGTGDTLAAGLTLNRAPSVAISATSTAFAAAQIAVPAVVGDTLAAAISAITGAQLNVGTETQQYSSTVPSGSVISQNPAAGTMVNFGTAVALVLSQGPQPVAVPNVVGAAKATAESAITGAGLTFTETQAYSSTVPSGSVISENPAAGTLVLPGTAVALVLSQGPQPVAVPNVMGAAKATAESAITGAGLTFTETQAYSSTVPSGSVISENPAAGTMVLPGTAVALVISQGPQPVAVPNVVGATQAAAESAITGAGLTFTETQAYSNTVPSGSVISENPAAGTMVQPGTAVALVISQGPQPVAVPNVVGATQAAAESAITGAGLTFTETQAYSNTMPSGWVISENPAAGTMVQPGTAVALVLSQGPQTFTVSGQIVQLNGAGPLAGATVSLGSGLTATTDGSGNFTIAGVPSGSYTLTPSFLFPQGSDPNDSVVFYPAVQSVSVSGSNVTGQNFTAQLGYTVSGTFSYTGALTRKPRSI
jgi:beta-lactam-binding protein with PASTA domain